MDAHAIQVLEFEYIVRELAGYALYSDTEGNLVKELVETIDGFAMTLEERETLKHAAEMLARICRSTGTLLSSFVDSVNEEIEILSKQGTVLELEQLAKIMRFVSASAMLRQFIAGTILKSEHTDKRDPSYLYFAKLVDSFPDTKAVEGFLNRFLDPAGQLKEDQIPELRLARQRIINTQADLRKAANQIVQAHASQLTSEIATIRDGRTVIPLKADYKGRIQGIVHQSSGSGNTLFIEPIELIERNNACTEAEHAYAAEVQRILRIISQRLSQETGTFREVAVSVSTFDKVYCRARFAMVHDCVLAVPGDDIRIVGARHPLLGKNAIPIDIMYESGKRITVVSGPNTGGKTVALKTLGLFVLMNQAGIAVPANPGTELPGFSKLYADIGDEQSISASLSTFSGHVARIASIVRDADTNTLVLLDELGSGTDPEEGAAIAIAVTETLIHKQCFGLITSHHGSLKALAFRSAGVVNASMEFSELELRPTYRLIMGLPGQSHALDIAGRVGLDSSILDRAREIVSAESTPLDELVRDLTRVREELMQTQAEYSGNLKRLGEREAGLDRKLNEIAKRELALRRSIASDTDAFLRESRSHVESLLRELAGFKQELSVEKQKSLEELSSKARETMSILSTEHEKSVAAIEDENRRPRKDVELSPGFTVVIQGSNQKGVIDRIAKNGICEVIVNGKRLRIDRSLLEISGHQDDLIKQNLKPSYNYNPTVEAVFLLDIRGMRAPDACDSVMRQLDAAMVGGLDYFGIIHGKGEGILQKSVHDLLGRSPGVERFEFARPEDGGTGKTLVYLRRS